MAYTTIPKSSDYFNTKLYTGNGGTQTITGVGFQSDFTWFKSRSAGNSHSLLDSVRGLGYALSSNLSGAEIPIATQTFNSDGYVLTHDGGAPSLNPNGVTTVAWNWKAGTAVSGSTTGSGTAKTYTGSVNTTSGFSIIKYVGNGTAGHTIPHHLGTANIGSIFVKNLDSGSDYWYNYHKPLGATKTLILNETDAVGTNTMWNNTAPTSSVFSVGTQSAVNTNNSNYIAYIFSDIQGYCKTGSYTGNGNADGTFIYTGFKPAFVIMKRTDSAGYDWLMYTNKINGINVMNDYLAPNTSAAEVVDNANQILDFTSNGFKNRGTGGSNNASGGSYIYMAVAEEPLVGDNPATAR